jgi:hypothetical protein
MRHVRSPRQAPCTDPLAAAPGRAGQGVGAAAAAAELRRHCGGCGSANRPLRRRIRPPRPPKRPSDLPCPRAPPPLCPSTPPLRGRPSASGIPSALSPPPLAPERDESDGPERTLFGSVWIATCVSLPRLPLWVACAPMPLCWSIVDGGLATMNTLHAIMEHVGPAIGNRRPLYTPLQGLQRPYSKEVPLPGLNRISILEPAQGPIISNGYILTTHGRIAGRVQCSAWSAGSPPLPSPPRTEPLHGPLLGARSPDG